MADNAGGIVRAELDGLAADAHGLQQISDQQAQLMNALGSTLEGLASTLVSDAAGPALQACGERLIHDGQQFSARFADHSDMMTNNRVNYTSTDEQSAQGFNAIQAGIRI